VLPKLNLSYTPTGDLTLYGTIAKGSRPGGVNIPIPLPTTPQLEANTGAYNCGLPLVNRLNPSLPVPPGLIYVTSQPSYFGPDSVWSFELGEKSRFDDRRFTLNADIYYIKWQNIQQDLALSCGYLYNAAVGNGEAYGPELEFTANIISGLSLYLSGAYTDAIVNDPTAASGIAPGTRIINVPKYTATAELNYETPIRPGIKGIFRVAGSIQNFVCLSHT
jgi:iron complex outermembrane receptor protein